MSNQLTLSQQTALNEKIRALRHEVRVGRNWRRGAWEKLTAALIDYAPGMREGGPIALVMYSEVLLYIVRYLTERPDLEKCRYVINLAGLDLTYYCLHMEKVSDQDLCEDVGAFTSMMLRLDGDCYTPAEEGIMYGAGVMCVECRQKLEILLSLTDA